MPNLPAIERLHERHPGISADHSPFMAAAAAICLTRFHRSPVPVLVGVDARAETPYLYQWAAINPAQQRAHSNRDDATTWGAYGVALAAVEADMGLIAAGRSGVGTGADWLLVGAGETVTRDGELDFENVTHFEVTGIGTEQSESDFRYRLGVKVKQVRRPARTALACVVAFSGPRVGIRTT